MTVYYRPSVYAVSHVFFGFIAVWIPMIGFLSLMYQLGQYFYNVRVFPLERRIEKGNSLAHTAIKIGEMAVGFVLGLVVKSFWLVDQPGKNCTH